MTGKLNRKLEDVPFQFGPWPKGMNTLQQDSEIDPDELRLALNVDITNDGHIRLRRGSYKAYSGSNVHSVGPGLLFAEGNALKKFNASTGTAATLRSGITPLLPIVYEPVNDSVYWTNSVDSGRIDSAGNSYPWGLQVPNAPVAVAASGGLLARGRYQLVCSFTAANGQESGTGLATYVDVPIDTGAIAITALPQPQSGQGVATINVHVSAVNGEVLYWHGAVGAGTRTYAIQWVETTLREARHRLLTAPPAGTLLTSRFGRIYIAKGNGIYWTEPFAYELHNPARNFAQFDSDIKVMRAVSNGLWVVTASGTYWLTGDNPNEARVAQQANYSAPLQQAVDIPDDNSVAWLSYRGWVIGDQDGNLKNLSDQRVGVNQTGARAITLYREKNAIRQFIGLISGSVKPAINSDDFAALL